MHRPMAPRTHRFRYLPLVLLIGPISLSGLLLPDLARSESAPLPRVAEQQSASAHAAQANYQFVSVPISQIETAVACTSRSLCFAVGGRLQERWNGLTWSSFHAPRAGVGLTSIACGAPTSCVAVGGTGNRTLFENWNGRLWSSHVGPRVPSTTSVKFVSVSCISRTFCMAVSQRQVRVASGSKIAYPSTFFGDIWNGRRWSVVALASPFGGVDNVTCIAANDCWTEGFVPDTPPGAGATPVADHWDGAAWTPVTIPPSIAQWIFKGPIACPTATMCWLLAGRTGIVSYTAGVWQEVPTPLGQLGRGLGAITCPAAADCWAVGGSGLPDMPAVAEEWNGQTWLGAATGPPTPGSAGLAAIACPSPIFCVAVGSVFAEPHSEPLAEVLKPG